MVVPEFGSASNFLRVDWQIETSKRNTTPSENKPLPTSAVLRRPTTLVLLALIVVVFLIGIGVARSLLEGEQFGRRITGPGPILGTTEVARMRSLGEQRGTCGGVPEPATLIRLNQSLRISSVVVCVGSMDGGELRVLRSARTANVLDVLSAALAASDDTSWRTPKCETIYPIVGSFTVQIAGHKMRLAMPIDECGFPKAAAQAALNSVISIAGK